VSRDEVRSAPDVFRSQQTPECTRRDLTECVETTDCSDARISLENFSVSIALKHPPMDCSQDNTNRTCEDVDVFFPASSSDSDNSLPVVSDGGKERQDNRPVTSEMSLTHEKLTETCDKSPKICENLPIEGSVTLDESLTHDNPSVLCENMSSRDVFCENVSSCESLSVACDGVSDTRKNARVTQDVLSLTCVDSFVTCNKMSSTCDKLSVTSDRAPSRVTLASEPVTCENVSETHDGGDNESESCHQGSDTCDKTVICASNVDALVTWHDDEGPSVSGGSNDTLTSSTLVSSECCPEWTRFVTVLISFSLFFCL